ncbi:MAG: ABC transporter substrate-binding protein [Deltaproteobacteria bacterium]|nr:ABC transporter substrate-binding protein [Deltaproteobacteria bacterium]
MRVRTIACLLGIALPVCVTLLLGFSVAMAQSSGAAAGKRKQEAAKKGMIYLTREEILEGAKKEGRVVVAPGHDEDTRTALTQAFKKNYPFIKEIDWRIVQGNDGEQRQLLEMKAGRTTLDVFSPHAAYYNEYRKFNPFKKYDLKAMAQDGQLEVPLEMIDDTGVVAWLGSMVGVVLYNSKTVPPDKAPTGWESCLDPQWKGKFTVDTKPITLAHLLPRWGEERLFDFARKLKQNEPAWSRGGTATITRLVTGEFSLFCGAYLHTVQRLLKKDPTLPVKVVVPNPLGIGFLEPEAVYADAKRPHAGLLWIDFLASKRGQEVVDSVNPGRGSLLVEGTVAYKLSTGTTVSLCGPGCFDRADQLMQRIAVEAWGFPKAGK